MIPLVKGEHPPVFNRKPYPVPVIIRAIRMLEGQFDRLLANEPHSDARAKRLCRIEERRTELADSIGAC